MAKSILKIEEAENIIRSVLGSIDEKDYQTARVEAIKAYEAFKGHSFTEGISVCLSLIAFLDYSEDKNAYEDATKNRVGNAKADVYCSYIIHDYFKDELGIIATSNVKTNKDDKIVGSGCYTR